MFDEHAPEYVAYVNAKARCRNPNHPHSKDYLGRGIEFKFKNYKEFLDDVGPRPHPDFQLDRINNNGHYKPGNVWWVHRKVNLRNKRNTRIGIDDCVWIKDALDSGGTPQELAKKYGVKSRDILSAAESAFWINETIEVNAGYKK